MADGFRVTEDGTRRVTESSDSRITEGFLSADCTLTGEGTATVVASLTHLVFTDLQATGSTLSAGELTVFGRADFTGTGTSAQTGNLVFDLTKQLDGVGSLSAQQTLILSGLSDLNGSGTLDATGFRIYFLESDLTGTGSLTSAATQTIQAEHFSGFDTFTRITETGDRRVTEDGSVRETELVPFNSGEGVIISFGDLIQFNSEPYIKVETDWKRFLPYVKYEDNWQVPERIYKNINGNWKRIF